LKRQRQHTRNQSGLLDDALEAVMSVNKDDAGGKAKGKGKEKKGEDEEQPSTIWLHCVVGDEMDEDETVERAEASQVRAYSTPEGRHANRFLLHVGRPDTAPARLRQTARRGLHACRHRVYTRGVSRAERDKCRWCAHCRAFLRSPRDSAPLTVTLILADDEEHARALEEQWMESIANPNEAPLECRCTLP
jgi:hypothetical protein